MDISKHMESFGSLRLLCKGGYCGEGILFAIKPTIRKVSKNVLENTAVTLMAKKSMSTIILNIIGADDKPDVILDYPLMGYWGNT
eukprot:3370570-Ditylum_brightwellii.AAC.1